MEDKVIKHLRDSSDNGNMDTTYDILDFLLHHGKKTPSVIKSLLKESGSKINLKQFLNIIEKKLFEYRRDKDAEDNLEIASHKYDIIENDYENIIYKITGIFLTKSEKPLTEKEALAELLKTDSIKELFTGLLPHKTGEMTSNKYYINFLDKTFPDKNKEKEIIKKVDKKPREMKEPLSDLPNLNFADDTVISKKLKEKIIGQDAVIEAIIPAICAHKSGFTPPHKKGPAGSFMFVGQSGVGKTELAETIANVCYDGNYFKLSMETYSQDITTSDLFGGSKGYVGYGDNSPLKKFLEKTRKLKDGEGAVLNLDEIEKAHPHIIQSFLGVLNDGQWPYEEEIYSLKNIFIIATSNIASELFKNNRTNIGFSEIKNFEDNNSKAMLRKEFSRRLRNEGIPPEFENRVEILIFNNLTREQHFQIINNKIKEMKTFIEDKFKKLKLKVKPDSNVAEVALNKAGEQSDGSSIRKAAKSVINDLPTKIMEKLRELKKEDIKDLTIKISGDKEKLDYAISLNKRAKKAQNKKSL